MLAKLYYGLFLLVLILSTVMFTQFLMKKFKLNRWIIGFAAFLILIIPNFLIENINPIIWNVLLLVSSVLCIMFFEITRELLQK